MLPFHPKKLKKQLSIHSYIHSWPLNKKHAQSNFCDGGILMPPLPNSIAHGKNKRNTKSTPPALSLCKGFILASRDHSREDFQTVNSSVQNDILNLSMSLGRAVNIVHLKVKT